MWGRPRSQTLVHSDQRVPGERRAARHSTARTRTLSQLRVGGDAVKQLPTLALHRGERPAERMEAAMRGPTPSKHSPLPPTTHPNLAPPIPIPPPSHTYANPTPPPPAPRTPAPTHQLQYDVHCLFILVRVQEGGDVGVGRQLRQDGHLAPQVFHIHPPPQLRLAHRLHRVAQACRANAGVCEGVVGVVVVVGGGDDERGGCAAAGSFGLLDRL
jgi:hypothetical protein